MIEHITYTFMISSKRARKAMHTANVNKSGRVSGISGCLTHLTRNGYMRTRMAVKINPMVLNVLMICQELLRLYTSLSYHHRGAAKGKGACWNSRPLSLMFNCCSWRSCYCCSSLVVLWQCIEVHTDKEVQRILNNSGTYSLKA